MALVLGQWDTLKWRRHGIGVLQAYLTSADDVETRVHVWSEKLVRPGIRGYGDIHDHRFDLTSFVLCGALEHTEMIPAEPTESEPVYQVRQVMHARNNPDGKFAEHPMRVVPGPLEATAKTTALQPIEFLFPSGVMYQFKRGHFHRSASASAKPTVTLVMKTNQIDAGARILGLEDAPMVPAFFRDDEHNEELVATAFRVLTSAKMRLEAIRDCG